MLWDLAIADLLYGICCLGLLFGFTVWICCMGFAVYGICYLLTCCMGFGYC